MSLEATTTLTIVGEAEGPAVVGPSPVTAKQQDDEDECKEGKKDPDEQDQPI